MRLIPALTLLMLVTIGVVIALTRLGPQSASAAVADDAARIAETRSALERLSSRLTFQSMLSEQAASVRPYPDTIDPSWFEPKLPRHGFIDDSHPWIEVAGPDERGRAHPKSIVALAPAQGGFWYDPTQGLIRARVPGGLLDADAIALYNALNGTEVTTTLP